MNIFFTHRAPELAAANLHDKHVVKMVLETAQIMSTVYTRYGQAAPYRPTHQNHPCVQWAGGTVAQYNWTAKHGLWLCFEYAHRYGRTHASQRVIEALKATPPGMHTAGWQDPPQCMPEEFQCADVVQAYRQYYLGRKVHQSRWTRRPVPAFVLQGTDMAKKPNPAAKTAAADMINNTPSIEASGVATGDTTIGDTTVGAAAVASADASVSAAENTAAAAAELSKVPLAKMRGPRGVPETAVITVLVANPKRPNSKAHAAFACYTPGITVGKFCDAVDALSVDGKSQKGMGTPHLVYDTKHGFISIDGYTVPGGVETPKPKAPPKPKVEKATKAPKTTAAKVDSPAAAEAEAAVTSANAAAVEAAVTEEVMD